MSRATATTVCGTLWDKDGKVPNLKKAVEWFRRSAERGMICSAYCLGKLLLTTEASDEAIRWLKYAADGGDQFAGYALGKIYPTGEYVPKDANAAVAYLSRSASQGNKYAQYFLDHLSDTRSPSVGLAVLRMFRHMANIFRDSAAQDATHMGLHIDRKRRRELQEKRIAMGHIPAKLRGAELFSKKGHFLFNSKKYPPCCELFPLDFFAILRYSKYKQLAILRNMSKLKFAEGKTHDISKENL